MSSEKQSYLKHSTDHWPEMAAVWKQIGPPLRPSQEDLDYLSQEIQLLYKDNTAPDALILGVTPELYHLPWPKHTNLMAVDHTQKMIDFLWPGPKGSATCADWINMPIESNSKDIVVCDGGLHLLIYPHKQHQLKNTLKRIIRPGGMCIFRLFTPPVNHESPEKVFEDLFNFKIPNLNILKLRLGMAIQKEASYGVALKDVWEKLNNIEPDFEKLAKQIKWPLEHLLAIHAYRNSESKYYFVTTDVVKSIFEDGFILKKVYTPEYELGDRCPTVIFYRTDS